MGGKRNRNRNKKNQEKDEEIKTEEKEVDGSEDQKNELGPDSGIENQESLNKVQENLADADEIKPSVEEAKEKQPEKTENFVESAKEDSVNKEGAKVNEEIKSEKVEAIENSEHSIEKSSKIHDSEAFASSESTPVIEEFKLSTPDLSLVDQEHLKVAHVDKKTEETSKPENKEKEENVKKVEKVEKVEKEEKEEKVESKKIVNEQNKEELKVSEVNDSHSTDPSANLKSLSYDDSRYIDPNIDTPEARFSDISDSKGQLPDLSNKLSSNSFLSHSSVDNSLLDTLTIDSSNPETSPSKKTIYSSLVPEIEPYYKKVHSDKDSHKSHECEFSIHYETQFGEKIVLVGDSEELGEWDIFKGIPLNWNPNHVWSAKIQISRTPVEYKYVCVSNETSIWEKGINHRYTGDVQKVQDSWQAI